MLPSELVSDVELKDWVKSLTTPQVIIYRVLLIKDKLKITELINEMYDAIKEGGKSENRNNISLRQIFEKIITCDENQTSRISHSNLIRRCQRSRFSQRILKGSRKPINNQTHLIITLRNILV
ncbi:unnamed protein product [Rhizophagus irregularis]|nr:unnamed protein product [Rhizophagus irregularis]